MTQDPHETTWIRSPWIASLPGPQIDGDEAPQRIHVMSLEAEVPLILDGTSALIWTTLTHMLDDTPESAQQGVSASAIAAQLVAGSDLEAQQIAPDIDAFLHQLAEQGLLRRVA